jgi:beta-glucosidase
MLKGFQKTTLAPGESRKVTFDVSADTFAFWGAENKFGVEPAHVTLWIAPNSAEGKSATLEITGEGR